MKPRWPKAFGEESVVYWRRAVRRVFMAKNSTFWQPFFHGKKGTNFREIVGCPVLNSGGRTTSWLTKHPAWWLKPTEQKETIITSTRGTTREVTQRRPDLFVRKGQIYAAPSLEFALSVCVWLSPDLQTQQRIPAGFLGLTPRLIHCIG